VESVAWISGRKEVLCGFFLLLSALCFHEHLTRDLVPREQVRKTTAFPRPVRLFYRSCLSPFGFSPHALPSDLARSLCKPLPGGSRLSSCWRRWSSP
jgi:hypothetical protein